MLRTNGGALAAALVLTVIPVAGIPVAGIPVAGIPAAAAEVAPPQPGTLDQALSRIADGSYTAADLTLVRQTPIVAAQVPDPNAPIQTGVTTGQSRGQVSTMVRSRGTCGHWVDVWFRQRSLLGSTIYKWHQRVVYCMTRHRVTKWQNRYDYLTNAQSIVYVRERVVNQKGGLGTRAAWSHMQRHLEYCVVKYGCYASVYPWSKITIYAGGGYTYRGSAH